MGVLDDILQSGVEPVKTQTQSLVSQTTQPEDQEDSGFLGGVKELLWDKNIEPLADTLVGATKSAGSMVGAIWDFGKEKAVDWLNISGVKDEKNGIMDINKFNDMYKEQITNPLTSYEDKEKLLAQAKTTGVINDNFFGGKQDKPDENQQYIQSQVESFKKQLESITPEMDDLLETRNLGRAVTDVLGDYESYLNNIMITSKDLDEDNKQRLISLASEQLKRYKDMQMKLYKSFAEGIKQGMSGDDAAKYMRDANKDAIDLSNELNLKLHDINYSVLRDQYFNKTIPEEFSKGEIIPGLIHTASQLLTTGADILERPLIRGTQLGMGLIGYGQEAVNLYRDLGVSDPRSSIPDKIYDSVADIFNDVVGNADHWLPQTASIMAGNYLTAGSKIKGLKAGEGLAEGLKDMSFLNKVRNLGNQEYLAYVTKSPKLAAFADDMIKDLFIFDGIAQTGMGYGMTDDTFMENQLFNIGINGALASLAKPVNFESPTFKASYKVEGNPVLTTNEIISDIPSDVIPLIKNGQDDAAEVVLNKYIIDKQLGNKTDNIVDINQLDTNTKTFINNVNDNFNKALTSDISDATDRIRINSALESSKYGEPTQSVINRYNRTQKIIGDINKDINMSSKMGIINLKHGLMSGDILKKDIDNSIAQVISADKYKTYSPDIIDKATSIVKYLTDTSESPNPKTVERFKQIYKESLANGLSKEMEVANKITTDISNDLGFNKNKLIAGQYYGGVYQYMGNNEFRDIVTREILSTDTVFKRLSIWDKGSKVVNYHKTFGDNITTLYKQNLPNYNIDIKSFGVNNINAFSNNIELQNIFKRNGFTVVGNSVSIDSKSLGKLVQVSNVIKEGKFNINNISNEVKNGLELALYPAIENKILDLKSTKLISDDGLTSLRINKDDVFPIKYNENIKTNTIGVKYLDKENVDKRFKAALKDLDSKEVLNYLDDIKYLDVSIGIVNKVKAGADPVITLKEYIKEGVLSKMYMNDKFKKATGLLDSIVKHSSDILKDVFNKAKDTKGLSKGIYSAIGTLFRGPDYIRIVDNFMTTLSNSGMAEQSVKDATRKFVRSTIIGLLYNTPESKQMVSEVMTYTVGTKLGKTRQIKELNSLIQQNKFKISEKELSDALYDNKSLRWKILNGLDPYNAKDSILGIIQKAGQSISINNQTGRTIGGEYLAAKSLHDIGLYNGKIFELFKTAYSNALDTLSKYDIGDYKILLADSKIRIDGTTIKLGNISNYVTYLLVDKVLKNPQLIVPKNIFDPIETVFRHEGAHIRMRTMSRKELEESITILSKKPELKDTEGSLLTTYDKYFDAVYYDNMRSILQKYSQPKINYEEILGEIYEGMKNKNIEKVLADMYNSIDYISHNIEELIADAMAVSSTYKGIPAKFKDILQWIGDKNILFNTIDSKDYIKELYDMSLQEYSKAGSKMSFIQNVTRRHLDVPTETGIIKSIINAGLNKEGKPTDIKSKYITMNKDVLMKYMPPMVYDYRLKDKLNNILVVNDLYSRYIVDKAIIKNPKSVNHIFMSDLIKNPDEYASYNLVFPDKFYDDLFKPWADNTIQIDVKSKMHLDKKLNRSLSEKGILDNLYKILQRENNYVLADSPDIYVKDGQIELNISGKSELLNFNDTIELEDVIQSTNESSLLRNEYTDNITTRFNKIYEGIDDITSRDNQTMILDRLHKQFNDSQKNEFNFLKGLKVDPNDTIPIEAIITNADSISGLNHLTGPGIVSLLGRDINKGIPLGKIYINDEVMKWAVNNGEYLDISLYNYLVANILHTANKYDPINIGKLNTVLDNQIDNQLKTSLRYGTGKMLLSEIFKDQSIGILKSGVDFRNVIKEMNEDIVGGFIKNLGNFARNTLTTLDDVELENLFNNSKESLQKFIDAIPEKYKLKQGGIGKSIAKIDSELSEGLGYVTGEIDEVLDTLYINMPQYINNIKENLHFKFDDDINNIITKGLGKTDGYELLPFNKFLKYNNEFELVDKKLYHKDGTPVSDMDKYVYGQVIQNINIDRSITSLGYFTHNAIADMNIKTIEKELPNYIINGKELSNINKTDISEMLGKILDKTLNNINLLKAGLDNQIDKNLFEESIKLYNGNDSIRQFTMSNIGQSVYWKKLEQLFNSKFDINKKGQGVFENIWKAANGMMMSKTQFGNFKKEFKYMGSFYNKLKELVLELNVHKVADDFEISDSNMKTLESIQKNKSYNIIGKENEGSTVRITGYIPQYTEVKKVELQGETEDVVVSTWHGTEYVSDGRAYKGDNETEFAIDIGNEINIMQMGNDFSDSPMHITGYITNKSGTVERFTGTIIETEELKTKNGTTKYAISIDSTPKIDKLNRIARNKKEKYEKLLNKAKKLEEQYDKKAKELVAKLNDIEQQRILKKMQNNIDDINKQIDGLFDINIKTQASPLEIKEIETAEQGFNNIICNL